MSVDVDCRRQTISIKDQTRELRRFERNYGRDGGNKSPCLRIVFDMILPVFGERPGFGAGAGGLSRRRCFWLIVPALVVFGAALCLPAYPIWETFEPGYSVALSTEAIAFEAGEKLARQAFGASRARGGVDLTDSWPILAGATANHLFALACLTTIFRRLRLAAVLAGLSALFAIGCLVPVQIMERENGWVLGPGYFVWCAAPVVLIVTTRRADRGSRVAGR